MKDGISALKKELLESGFDLDNHIDNESIKPIEFLEEELLKSVYGGRHEKTNADGSKDVTFIKVGPVAY